MHPNALQSTHDVLTSHGWEAHDQNSIGQCLVRTPYGDHGFIEVNHDPQHHSGQLNLALQLVLAAGDLAVVSEYNPDVTIFQVKEYLVLRVEYLHQEHLKHRARSLLMLAETLFINLGVKGISEECCTNAPT